MHSYHDNTINYQVGYVKRAREKDKKKKLTNMICYLFEKAAKEQHTMIILDDAQWIDKDSWIMLYEIIKRCRVSININKGKIIFLPDEF